MFKPVTARISFETWICMEWRKLLSRLMLGLGVPVTMSGLKN
jgi:hypothetical protein